MPTYFLDLPKNFKYDPLDTFNWEKIPKLQIQHAITYIIIINS